MNSGTLDLRKDSYSLMILESSLESLAFAKISRVYVKVNLVVAGLFLLPRIVTLHGALSAFAT